MKRRFQRGDIVRLNSGGPPMTVREEKKGTVTCDWSEGDTTRRDGFYSEQLSPVAKQDDDLEIARKIAFLLQQALVKKGDPAPNTVDEAIHVLTEEQPKT